MAKRKPPSIVVRFDGNDMFIELMDGTKIARRGHPGTPEARTWVSLHPNYVVTADDSTIYVDFTPDQGAA